MVAIAHTVAFEGVEARLVEVQCSISPGLPGFGIVGLPDKSVSEARERVRAAFAALSIALPSRRITVNMSPADLPKEGSHFDLPIALSVLAALEILPAEALAQVLSLGELALDGRLSPVAGALPAAMAAAEQGFDLLVPAACAAEGAWVGAASVFGPRTLRDAIDHLGDRAPLTPAQPGEAQGRDILEDLDEVKGQERARRAIEIAAAGRHHLLMLQHTKLCGIRARNRMTELEILRLERLGKFGRWRERLADKWLPKLPAPARSEQPHRDDEDYF